MIDQPVIAVAGAGGDLGGRIARALVARGATVRALVRPGLETAERARIEALGAASTYRHDIDRPQSGRGKPRPRTQATAAATWQQPILIPLCMVFEQRVEQAGIRLSPLNLDHCSNHHPLHADKQRAVISVISLLYQGAASRIFEKERCVSEPQNIL